jgi:GTP-binding protein HflX
MTLHTTATAKQKAILVGVQLPQMTEIENQSSLDELARLVTTLGYGVVGRMSQRRSSTKGAAVLGDGKLQELARWTEGPGFIASMVVRKKHKAALKFKDSAEDEDGSEGSIESGAEDEFESDSETETENENSNLDSSDIEESEAEPQEIADVVVFDCDLSPSQLRNLESATGAKVLDRTGVIIEIFSRHARTKAARLQVEIARLTYVAPRLRETGGGEDRQGGGVGGKGAGESSLELDRRKIRDRIKELKTELAAIGQEHITRRARREQEACVALVGYTNAGKSSLMRAMTGSEVLIADKLFATLDTTVRPVYPETQPKILLSDTVGFIKKLPHDLVASFKSTLDEALNASLLLYVVDASDPSFRSQLEVTQKVLEEVGAHDTPSFLVLNKKDRLSDEEFMQLQAEFPEAIFLSTRDSEDLKSLRELLIRFFEKDMVEEELFVPYMVKGAIGDIRSHTRVLSESYTENGLQLTVRGPQIEIARIIKKYLTDLNRYDD